MLSLLATEDSTFGTSKLKSGFWKAFSVAVVAAKKKFSVSHIHRIALNRNQLFGVMPILSKENEKSMELLTAAVTGTLLVFDLSGTVAGGKVGLGN